MLFTRSLGLVVFAVSLFALLVVAATVAPAYTLAQEATPSPPTPTPVQASGRDPFPWWEIVAAFATALLAISALYASFVSLRHYLAQRQRDTDLDLAKLQGELVTLLRHACDRAQGSPNRLVLKEQLEKAEYVYEGTLRGIMLVRPELMKAAREALTEYLKEATSALKKLREESR